MSATRHTCTQCDLAVCDHIGAKVAALHATLRYLLAVCDAGGSSTLVRKMIESRHAGLAAQSRDEEVHEVKMYMQQHTPKEEPA